MTTKEMLEKLNTAENTPFDKIHRMIDEDDYLAAIECIKDYFKCDDDTAKIVCMDFEIELYDPCKKNTKEKVSEDAFMSIAEKVDKLIVCSKAYDIHNYICRGYSRDLALEMIRRRVACSEEEEEALLQLFEEKYKTIDEAVKTLKYCSDASYIYNYINEGDRVSALETIREYVECKEEYEDIILQLFLKKYKSYKEYKALEEAKKPKCPTCGSTNVKKIPAFFQVPAFPGGAYKQFRCKNCSYEW